MFVSPEPMEDFQNRIFRDSFCVSFGVSFGVSFMCPTELFRRFIQKAVPKPPQKEMMAWNKMVTKLLH
jgi:hypothetical protein